MNGAIGLNVAKRVGEDIEFVGGPSSTHQKIILALATNLRTPVLTHTHSLQKFNSISAIRITVQVHSSVNMALDLENYNKTK